MALLAPLKADKQAWEASFTEEEKAKGAEFEEQLKASPDALTEFMGQIDSTFAEADADSNGVLTRDEFKVFVTKMDEHGVNRGLKHRETTDEFVDTVYPSFNGFNEGTDGVSKQEILVILNMINM